jgi:hypothetical protein
VDDFLGNEEFTKYEKVDGKLARQIRNHLDASIEMRNKAHVAQARYEDAPGNQEYASALDELKRGAYDELHSADIYLYKVKELRVILLSRARRIPGCLESDFSRDDANWRFASKKAIKMFACRIRTVGRSMKTDPLYTDIFASTDSSTIDCKSEAEKDDEKDVDSKIVLADPEFDELRTSIVRPKPQRGGMD